MGKIKTKLRTLFDASEYDAGTDAINESNLNFYRLFDYIMIGLLLSLYASTFFSDYASNLASVYWVFISLSVAELVLLHFFGDRIGRFTPWIIYYGIAKAYLFCLLTSVFFNRGDSAITYYIFLILLPVSFLLRPKVLYGAQTAALVVFSVCTALVKPFDIASGDILACLMFYVISLVIGGEVGRLRISNISMVAAARKHSLKLEGQSRLLGEALRISKLCVWRYDCDSGCLTPTFTPAAYAAYGKMVEGVPESLIGGGLIHRDSIPVYRKMYAAARRGETSIQGDVRIRTNREEDFCWFHISMTPEPGQGEKKTVYIGTSEDIAERKLTELHYEEQLHLLDSANEANLITKGQWNLTSDQQEVVFNRNGKGLPIEDDTTFEAARDELLSHVFPAGKRAEMTRALDRTALIDGFRRGVDAYSFEYQRYVETRSPIWVNMLVHVCQVPGKEDVMCFGFSYDITNEVMNRSIIERLVAVEFDFLGTVDLKSGKSIVQSMNVSDPDYMRPADGKANDDYETAMSYAVGACVAEEERSHVMAACDLRNVAAHLAQEQSYLVSFTTTENGEMGRKKLEYCYLDDTKETILYYRTDVTELYRQEQEQLRQVRDALARMEQANAAKTDFLSRMSHDMRTPMNGIIGMTRLTQELPELPEEAVQNLNAIADSSNFLLSLINDTLDMSRIERSTIVLVPEIIDVDQLVRNIYAIVKRNLEEKKIRFTYDMVNTTSRFIRADRVRVQQILLNILSNAIKFTPEGGTIHGEIECLSTDGHIAHDKLTITDNGIGMSKEFLSRIFEPFSQENSRLTNRQVGTGLGMSIVKNLVELMGGRIEIKSEQGKGTAVTLYMDFERVDGAAAEQEEAAESANEEVLRGKHVLLAEDHPLNRTIALRLLEKKSMAVDVAEDGEQAVAKFAASAVGFYDVILMDIRMPNLDGWEAASRIRGLARADAGTVKIIAMSANAFEDDVQRSLAVGMNDHLSKPVEPERVYATLAKHLGR